MRRLQARNSAIAITAGLALGGWPARPRRGRHRCHASQLNAVAIVSLKNAWAVGLSTDAVTSVASTLIEHWNGTRWRIGVPPGFRTGIQ